MTRKTYQTLVPSVLLSVGLIGCTQETPTRTPSIAPLLVSELATTTESGGSTVPIKIVSVFVTADSGTNPLTPPDFTNVPADGLPLGCAAIHFDNGVLEPTADAGVVRVTGLQTAPLLAGGDAPAEINCNTVAGGAVYRCGFGPIPTSGSNPNTLINPYAGDAEPIRTGDRFTFSSTGRGRFGSFSVTTNPAPDTISGNFSAVQFKSQQGLSIPLTCPEGTCSGFLVADIDVYAGQTQLGNITCAQLAGATLEVPMQAVNAALGCNPGGTGCDTTIDRGRIIIERVSAPLAAAADSNGNTIANFIVGQGVLQDNLTITSQ